MASETTLTVDGSPMRVVVTAPAGAGPHKAVLLAHHRDGIDKFTLGVAARLAENGILAVTPNFYHRRPADENPHESVTKLKDSEMRADIDATVAAMKKMPNVRADAIGIIGHCLGGRTSFLGAATNDTFKASVILYGGGILVARGDGPPPFDFGKNIKCPVLGLFGKDDQNPKPEDVAKVSAELKKHDIRHDFHIYDGAGHAFQNPDGERYRPQQSEDAWKRLLAFLKSEL